MVYHGWHDGLHDAENDGIAGFSGGSSSKRGSFPCFAEGQSVVVHGREYLFEPAKRECEKALGIPRDEMGGLGVKRCIINFFDYHQSIGCDDFRGSYLARLYTVSEESTQDGFQRIRWRNMYSPNAHRARQAAQEYLSCFLYPDSSERILEIVDGGFRNVSLLTNFERGSKTISVGEQFFNSVFYASLVEAATDLIPSDLREKMLWGDGTLFQNPHKYSRPANKLVVDFDEVLSFRFVLQRPTGEYEMREPNRFERNVECSASDLGNYLLPWLTLISGWSLVLGVYLATRMFGSCAVTVGDYA